MFKKMSETKTTIYDLISYLQTLPSDLRVCIPGYEGGYADINLANSKQETLLLNVNSEYYYGPHDYLDCITESEASRYNKELCLILLK